MFSESWTKNHTNETEIISYSYSVYHAFIKYLYTNCIEIEFEEIFNLYNLANPYLVKEFIQKCIEILKNNVSIANFCNIYITAIKYNSEKLKKYFSKITYFL
jgi:hypothetical protein